MNDKVVIALNSLLQELDVILLDFNERFIQLTTQKRLDEAQTALDEAKKIATLQRQIQNLQEEWFHPGPQKGSAELSPNQREEHLSGHFVFRSWKHW